MSTQVSNPYTFTITSNRSFSSPGIVTDLPSSDTWLSFDGSTNTVTIPNGVKVLKIIITVSDPTSEGTEAKLYFNNKIVASAYTRDSDQETTYVKVTPGKTYSRYFELDSYARGTSAMYYSSSINNHATTTSAD